MLPKAVSASQGLQHGWRVGTDRVLNTRKVCDSQAAPPGEFLLGRPGEKKKEGLIMGETAGQEFSCLLCVHSQLLGHRTKGCRETVIHYFIRLVREAHMAAASKFLTCSSFIPDLTKLLGR